MIIFLLEGAVVARQIHFGWFKTCRILDQFKNLQESINEYKNLIQNQLLRSQSEETGASYG